MREFMQSQTAAFNEFTTTLKEQNLRLQHLEEYHLQELSKREQTAQGTQTTESK